MNRSLGHLGCVIWEQNIPVVCGLMPDSPQRLIEERDALREANEELRCAQVQQKFLNQAGKLFSE